jgi:hypothetical protein
MYRFKGVHRQRRWQVDVDSMRISSTGRPAGILNLNKMQGLPHESSTAGFVLMAEEIDTECRRHRRLLEAKIAQECLYDPEKFRQQLAGTAE